MSYCLLILTCSDTAEASAISTILLEKHLIACAKQVRADSSFLWKGGVDYNGEIVLLMDSREDLFSKVESEVKKLHSYETFVLQAIPVNQVSADAANWLKDTLEK